MCRCADICREVSAYISKCVGVFQCKGVCPPGAVTKSVERRLSMREIEGLVPSQVKPMTYKIDVCRFLAWHLPLIGSG